MGGGVSRNWKRCEELCPVILSKSTLSWKLWIAGGPVIGGRIRLVVLRG